MLIRILGLSCIFASPSYGFDGANYVTLSAQLKNFYHADVLSNNIANSNTTAYKADTMILREYKVKVDRNKSLSFGNDFSTVRDLSQGGLTKTGRSLDIAISGDGFFVVESAEGNYYTRNGNLTMDANGVLITQQGLPILTIDNARIIIPAEATDITIRENGLVTVGAEELAVINVVMFENMMQLQKVGNGMYKTDGDTIPAANFKILQGFVEGSNVNGIEQLTKLIEIQQGVANTSGLLSSMDDLRRSTLRSIAKQN